jgi:hypothetical protein
LPGTGFDLVTRGRDGIAPRLGLSREAYAPPVSVGTGWG